MSKKFTIEQVQDIFNNFGLQVLETESKGIDYKYKCIDKDGYLYSRSAHSAQATLKKGRKNNGHIFSTKNPYFYDNMIHYIDKYVKNGTILLTPKDRIKNIDQDLKFRCGECGREYSSTWHNFFDKKEKCCIFCFNQKRKYGEVPGNHRDSNKFHIEARKRGLLVLDGPQIRYHDKINVQDVEGYRGVIWASRLLEGSSFERFSVRNPFTIDNLRVFAFKNGWDCIIYNQEYKGDKMPIKMLCSCGNEFTVDTNHFVAGKFQCNECRIKQSHIAKSVQNYLEDNKILYNKEKTFEGCENKKKLPFDFYLPDYNACIEVDGIGHFRPVAFGGQKDEAQYIYEQRVQNDFIKTKYCKNNDIPLLRLPFWEIENGNYKNLISDFILSIESNDFNK